MKIILNKRKRFALIFMTIGDSLLYYMNTKKINIKDGRLTNALKAIDEMYKKLSMGLAHKEQKEINRTIKFLLKQSKYKDMNEFELLVRAWYSLYFIEEAFNKVYGIKQPCATAKYWIKEYLKKHYHLSNHPEYDKQFMDITLSVILEWHREGFLNLDIILKKAREEGII